MLADAVLSAAIIGLGATAAIDLWNLLLKRAFGVSSLSYCLLGRWLSHMPGGTFRHPSIGAARPKPLECAVGWLAHYSIGVAFAVLFVAVVSPSWLRDPTLVPAMLFGIATVVFPLFVMQPALGLGVAASRAPNPPAARLKSLGTHAVFGLGLYAVALLLRSVTPLT